MTKDAFPAEAAVLDLFEPRWRKRGYEVVRAPTAEQLPDFLAGSQPDAIAIGRTPSLVIEILRPHVRRGDQQRENFGARLAGHDDWKLEVVGIMPDGPTFAPETAESVRAALSYARELAEGAPNAALLMAWAALEAAGRRLEPRFATGGLSTGALLDVLVSNGHIEQDDGSRLRAIAEARNRILHGQLDVRASTRDVGDIVALAEPLVAGD